jgi:phage anti-repressor protein
MQVENAFPIVSQTKIGGGICQTVDARELWTYLLVETKFADWIKRRLDECRFQQDIDFVHFSNLGNSDRTIDYALTIYVAKHNAMMERTERGFAVRDYFIECEHRVIGGPPNCRAIETVTAASRATASSSLPGLLQDRNISATEPSKKRPTPSEYSDRETRSRGSHVCDD